MERSKTDMSMTIGGIHTYHEDILQLCTYSTTSNVIFARPFDFSTFFSMPSFDKSHPYTLNPCVAKYIESRPLPQPNSIIG